MMKLFRFLLPGLVALTLMFPVGAATPVSSGWTPLKSERADARQVLKVMEVEILSASGTLVVNTPYPIQVKVFTILGRLVSNETLPAGNHQLLLPAHGVYIVQIGEKTCTVAV